MEFVKYRMLRSNTYMRLRYVYSLKSPVCFVSAWLVSKLLQVGPDIPVGSRGQGFRRASRTILGSVVSCQSCLSEPNSEGVGIYI